MIAGWIAVIAAWHGLRLLMSAEFMQGFNEFMFRPYLDFWNVHLSGSFSINAIRGAYQNLPDQGKTIFWLIAVGVVAVSFFQAIRLSQLIACFIIALFIFRVIISGFALSDTKFIIATVAAALWLMILALGSGGSLIGRLISVWQRFRS